MLWNAHGQTKTREAEQEIAFELTLCLRRELGAVDCSIYIVWSGETQREKGGARPGHHLAHPHRTAPQVQHTQGC